MNIIKNIIPNYSKQKKEYTFFQKIKYVLFCFIYAYCLIIGLRLLFEIMDVILNFFGFALIGDFQINNYKLKEKTDLKLIFELLIFAPVVEEIIFRLPLSLKSNHFIIALFLTLGLTMNYFLKSVFNLEFYFLSFYGLYLLTIYTFKSKIKNLFKINFLISTLLFGLFHILNYKTFESNSIGFYFLNVMPMIVFGYYFAKTRLKFNVFWSVLLHTISNIIPYLVIISNK